MAARGGALSDDGRAVYGERTLEIFGEGLQLRVTQVCGRGIDLGDGVTPDRLTAHQPGFRVVETPADGLDERRGHVGAGTDCQQQRVVDAVDLSRGTPQLVNVLVTAYRRPPAVQGREQQCNNEQQQHPDHPGANFQMGKHGHTPQTT